MPATHDDSIDSKPEVGYSSYQSSKRRWTTDDVLRRQRLNDQVAIIVDCLDECEVHVDNGGPDDPHREAVREPQYLFRRGRLLVRDADVGRVDRVVQRAYGGQDPDNILERIETGIDDRRPPGLPRPIAGLSVYLLPEGVDTEFAIRLIDEQLGVGVVTPDHVLYVTGNAGCCPATEPEQPGRRGPSPEINKDAATSGAGVLVSVVDTGLLTDMVKNHPWLAGVQGDTEESDPEHLRHYVGHGTFISGIVRCMAPKVDVFVDGFLPNGGAVYESEIVRQLGEALNRVPDIVNLSAGAWTRKELPLLSFQVLWETRLRHLKGTVVVAAAGNDGNRGPFWPAAFPWTLSVGALDATCKKRADYTNFGSWVDVYAQGSDVVNAFPNGRYVYSEGEHKGQADRFETGLAKWSGTSFATPIVAGLIAARMSRTGESARDAADALKRLAVANAKPGVGPILLPGMAARS